MTPDLPFELKAALERKAEGLSRNDAAKRATIISDAYRSGGNSKTITTADDALAYALARMPGTYAAVAACIKAMSQLRPDFAPRSLIDVGAGPGTASWSAAQAYGSLTDFVAADANAALRDLALELARGSSRLSTLNYIRGDALRSLDGLAAADLVIASYVTGELDDAKRSVFADLLWSKARDALMIVEPGTPSGFRRIIEMRARLIAGGAHVIAPCPHENDCPLVPPDWCHFSQRLQRSRLHKHLKGAELPYEDEKFSYVILMRAPSGKRPARILAQPKVSKIAVSLKLCTPGGVEIANVPSRDKANYSIARKLNWGDVTPEIGAAPE